MHCKRKGPEDKKHCRKSLVCSSDEPCEKNSASCFDTTMRSNDRAEICELVGIYIQSQLAHIIGKIDYGLYRDTGLILSQRGNS